MSNLNYFEMKIKSNNGQKFLELNFFKMTNIFCLYNKRKINFNLKRKKVYQMKN